MGITRSGFLFYRVFVKKGLFPLFKYLCFIDDLYELSTCNTGSKMLEEYVVVPAVCDGMLLISFAKYLVSVCYKYACKWW